ncbi:MAG: NUDIX domain-containing protein [Planctomycetaceae bacterium]
MSEPLASAFRFCPRCGQERPDSGSNPFACAACDFAYYFSPVTAVGAIVTDAEDRVLFIRRAKNPGQGKLGLPGGFVDPGESLEQALVREVFEEAGLKAIEMDYLTSQPNQYLYRGVEIAVTDMFFHARVETFETLDAIDGEAADFCLVVPTKTELDEMAFASNRLALEYFLSR